jgi:hypothetical protein
LCAYCGAGWAQGFGVAGLVPISRLEIYVIILLGITVILVVVAFGMLMAMVVRDEPFLGAIGVCVLMAAGFPGAWYGLLAH